MPCRDCNADTVLQVEIIDLSEDEPQLLYKEFCVSCLRKKGLYCDIHGKEKLMVFDPVFEAVKDGNIPVSSTCLECCLAKTREVPPEKAAEYAQLLRESTSETFQTGFADLVEVFARVELDSPYDLLFGAIMASDLFKRTLEQGVTDLVIGGSHSRRT